MGSDHAARRGFDEAYPRLVVIAFREALAFSAATGRRVDAEDLAADAMTLLLARWETVPHSNREGWVVLAVRNLGRNALRKEFRRSTTRALTDTDAVTPDHSTSVIDADQIRLALRTLPRRERQVAELRLVLDLTTDETATVLGISAGTVKGYWSSARQRLREHIDPTRLTSEHHRRGGEAT